MKVKTTAAKMLPRAMVFLPAELVVCCVGVLLALLLPFAVLETANVVCEAVAVATPAFPVVGAPVTRTAPVVDVPVVVWKTT